MPGQMKSLIGLLVATLVLPGCDLVRGDGNEVSSDPSAARVAEDSIGWNRQLADAGDGYARWVDADASGSGSPDGGASGGGGGDGRVEPDDAGAVFSPEPCSRDCLADLLTDTLNALVEHAPEALPLRSDALFIEDSRVRELGTGVWQSLTALGRYRQDILDPQDGVAGAHVVVEQDGKSALMVLRLQVVGKQIEELEVQLTRSSDEGGGVFEPGSLRVPNEVTNAFVGGDTGMGRNLLMAVAEGYAVGLRAGGFAQQEGLFSDNAFRVENGRITAGLGCTSSVPACMPPQDQERSAFPSAVDYTAAVDQDKGLVWVVVDLGPESGSGDGSSVRVWAILKLLDGRIRAVETFQKLLPAEVL